MGDDYSWRVMVSSTMQDLPRERVIAEGVITSEGLTPWYAERPPTELTGSAYDLSCAMAQMCDLYLLVVGSRYGSHPDGMPANDPRSVTHLEFDLARAANPRKVRVFLPHDAVAIAESDAQRQFVAQVTEFRNGYDCFIYDRTDLRTLEDLVRHAIQQWRDTAGRDTYCVTIRDAYRTERNPVTGAEMDANATVLLKLRTEALATSRGSGAAWDEQLDEEEAQLHDDRDSARHGQGEVRKRRGRRPAQVAAGVGAEALAQIQERAKPVIAQVNDFLVRFGRLVLLGEVGAGKSTLLRRLAYDVAQEALTAQNVTPRLLPILVRASDLGRVALERPDASAAEVVGMLAERLTANASLKPLYRAVVAEALYRGAALLLVDGLDEAQPAEQQAVFAALRGLEANQMVLASRPAAYHEELSGATWRVCQVQRLDPDQRRVLITAVFRAITAEGRGPDDDAPILDPAALERELEQRSDLLTWAGNPLLLTLIATQYARDARLPESRARIYQFAIEDMRRQRATTARRYFTEEELDRLQRELALRMTEAGVRLTTLEEARDRFLGELLRDMAPDSTPATHDACAREVLDRSGVLQQVDAERWEFIHLSFREYLAACALAAMDHSTRWQVVRTRALSAQWEQVFFLLCSRLDTERHESQVDALLRALIARDRARVPVLGGPDPTHTALRLATRCFLSRPMRARTPRLRAALVAAWRPLLRGMLWRTTMQSTMRMVFSDSDVSFADFTFNTEPEHLSPGALLLPTTGHWIHWINRKSEGNNLGCLLALAAMLTIVCFPLLFVFVVIGHLTLAIPGATQSGLGQWLVSSLPPFTLSLLLLYAGLRLLLQRFEYEGHAEEALTRTLVSNTLESSAAEAIAAPALIGLLFDRKGSTAGRTLGAIGTTTTRNAQVVLALLLMALRDGPDSARETAMAAIERMGPVAANAEVIAELLTLLKRSNTRENVRKEALRALGALGSSVARNGAVIAELVACMEDKNEEVRVAAVNALAKLGPAAVDNEAVITGLLAALKRGSLKLGYTFEKSRDEAGQALVALRSVGPANDALITGLLALVNDRDSHEARGAGVRALRRLGPAMLDNEAVITGLLACLKDTDDGVRAETVTALAEWVTSEPTRVSSDVVITELLACLGDKDRWVRRRAVEALGSLLLVMPGTSDRETVVTALRARVEDHEEVVRLRAVEALGPLLLLRPAIPGRETIVTALQARLNDWGGMWSGSEGAVCIAAARALELGGEAGAAAVVTKLLTWFDDKDQRMRQQAARELKELGPEVAGTTRVIERLQACLNDPSMDVRLSAAAALETLASGPMAPADEAVIADLIADLLVCLDDQDKDVRTHAVVGLEALGRRLWGNEAVAAALVAHLKDVNWDVRNAAASVLETKGPASIGTETLMLALLAHLGIPIKTSRVAHRKRIRRLGRAMGDFIDAIKNWDWDEHHWASRVLQSVTLAADAIPSSEYLVRRVRRAAARPRWRWAFDLLVLVQRLCDWPVVICAIAAQVLVIWPTLAQLIHLPAPVSAVFGLTAWWQILLLMVGYLVVNGALAYASLSLAQSQAEQRIALLSLLERLLASIDNTSNSETCS